MAISSIQIPNAAWPYRGGTGTGAITRLHISGTVCTTIYPKSPDPHGRLVPDLRGRGRGNGLRDYGSSGVRATGKLATGYGGTGTGIPVPP